MQINIKCLLIIYIFIGSGISFGLDSQASNSLVQNFLCTKQKIIKQLRNKLIFKNLKNYIKEQGIKNNKLVPLFFKNIKRILYFIKTDRYDEAMLILNELKEAYKINFLDLIDLQNLIILQKKLRYGFHEISSFKLSNSWNVHIAWYSNDKIIRSSSKNLRIINVVNKKSELEINNALPTLFDTILLSPDETKIALNIPDGHVDLLIYDLKNKVLLKGFETLTPQNGAVIYYPIKAFAWSPCSSKIAVSFCNGIVIIYDIQSKKQLNRFKFDCYIHALSWASDGNKLICNKCNEKNSVYLLDIESGIATIVYNHNFFDSDGNQITDESITKFLWLSDTTFAACSIDRIVFYDIEQKKILKVFYSRKK